MVAVLMGHQYRVNLTGPGSEAAQAPLHLPNGKATVDQ
jgi:hypothetical protein